MSAKEHRLLDELPDWITHKDSALRQLQCFLYQIEQLIPPLRDVARRTIDILETRVPESLAWVKRGEHKYEVPTALKHLLHEVDEVFSPAYQVIDNATKINILIDQLYSSILYAVRNAIKEIKSGQEQGSKAPQKYIVLESITIPESKIQHVAQLLALIQGMLLGTKRPPFNKKYYMHVINNLLMVRNQEKLEILPSEDYTYDEKLELRYYQNEELALAHSDTHAPFYQQYVDDTIDMRPPISIVNTIKKLATKNRKASHTEFIDVVYKTIDTALDKSLSLTQFSVRKTFNMLRNEYRNITESTTGNVKIVSDILKHLHSHDLDVVWSVPPETPLPSKDTLKSELGSILRLESTTGVSDERLLKFWYGLLTYFSRYESQLISAIQQLPKMTTFAGRKSRPVFQKDSLHVPNLKIDQIDIAISYMLYYINYTFLVKYGLEISSQPHVSLTAYFRRCLLNLSVIYEMVSSTISKMALLLVDNTKSEDVVKFNLNRSRNVLFLVDYIVNNWPIFMPYLVSSKSDLYSIYEVLEFKSYINAEYDNGVFDTALINQMQQNSLAYIRFGRTKSTKKSVSGYSVMLDTRHTLITLFYVLDNVYEQYQTARRIMEKHLSSTNIEKQDVQELVKVLKSIHDRLCFMTNTGSKSVIGMRLDKSTGLYHYTVLRDYLHLSLALLERDTDNVGRLYKHINNIFTKKPIDLSNQTDKAKADWYKTVFDKIQ